MSSFLDIPVELIIHAIFPNISIRDFLVLGCVNRALANVVNDEPFWERRCEVDFGFNRGRLPDGYLEERRVCWKRMYKKLANSIMFGWGSPDHGRLGRPDVDEHTQPWDKKVSYPVTLPCIPGVRIARLVAGGWSVVALDTLGRVHVLGALDGSGTCTRDTTFENPHKQAHQFHRLSLPTTFRSISCNVDSMVGLDDSNSPWCFSNWGTARKLTSPLIDGSSQNTTVVQAVCGKCFVVFLMRSGAVYLWWYRVQRPAPAIIQAEEERVTMGSGADDQTVRMRKVIPCNSSEFPADLHLLQDIPFDTLPNVRTLKAGQLDDELATRTSPKLVQIALVGRSLIGLTDQGHFLLLRSRPDEGTLGGMDWEYLPEFSDVDEVCKVLTQAGVVGRTTANILPMTNIASNSSTLRFIVYRPAHSCSDRATMLYGKLRATNLPRPIVIPKLQDLPVISVSLGDWHIVALTADGRVLSWGNDMQGTLGLGDSMAEQRVTSPQEVQPFGVGPSKVFCVGVTAMGWHTAVLAVDLEDTGRDCDDEQKLEY